MLNSQCNRRLTWSLKNPDSTNQKQLPAYGRAVRFLCSPAMARDGELIQSQYFCHHADTICHPNSSYVTTKLYETSACGCNNNTIFQNELFLRFLPSTYVCSLAAQKGDSMSNQSLLALFRTTHLRFRSIFACQFTSMREATVPNFRKIGQAFFELQPSEKLKSDPENRD